MAKTSVLSRLMGGPAKSPIEQAQQALADARAEYEATRLEHRQVALRVAQSAPGANEALLKAGHRLQEARARVEAMEAAVEEAEAQAAVQRDADAKRERERQDREDKAKLEAHAQLAAEGERAIGAYVDWWKRFAESDRLIRGIFPANPRLREDMQYSEPVSSAVKREIARVSPGDSMNAALFAPGSDVASAASEDRRHWPALSKVYADFARIAWAK